MTMIEDVRVRFVLTFILAVGCVIGVGVVVSGLREVSKGTNVVCLLGCVASSDTHFCAGFTEKASTVPTSRLPPTAKGANAPLLWRPFQYMMRYDMMR